MLCSLTNYHAALIPQALKLLLDLHEVMRVFSLVKEVDLLRADPSVSRNRGDTEPEAAGEASFTFRRLHQNLFFFI